MKKNTWMMTAIMGIVLAGAMPTQASDWTPTGGGDWHTGGNWSVGVPDASGAVANFNSDITSDISVDLSASATVGTVTFEDAADAGSGYNSFTINGANTLTFDGGATVNANRGTNNEIAVDINTGSQQLQVHVPVAGDKVVFSGSITGTGGLQKYNDVGAIELLGDNSAWSGTKLFRVGRYGVGSDTCFGSGTVQINSGTIYSVGGDRIATNIVVSNTGAVALDFDGANGYSLNFTADFALAFANVSGPGRLVFSGNMTSIGTLQGMNSSGRIDLSGSNGTPATVRAKDVGRSLTLGIGHDYALGTGASINIVRDVTLVSMGQARTITQNLPMNSATLTVDGDFGLTLAGNLTANGGSQLLVKNGLSSLTLLGNNTYAGGTTINGGLIVVGHTNALGAAGTITVNSNGTLAVANGIAFSRAVTFNAGSALGGEGTFSPGSAWSVPVNGFVRPGLPIGTLTVDQNVTFGDNRTLEIDFASDDSADKLIVSGTIDLTSLSDRIVLRGELGSASEYEVANATAVNGEFDLIDSSGLIPTGARILYPGDGRILVLQPPLKGTVIMIR